MTDADSIYNKMFRGLLVVIEGINGAGKSTIIYEMMKHYKATGVDVSLYKFPDRSGDHGGKINEP